MAEKKIAPFGAWQSPITSTVIASGTLRLSETQYDGDDLYWIEGRPAEGGRQVLVKLSADGEITDVSPQGFNVRSLVNEYGGAPFLVRDKMIFCCNFSDQVVYQLNPDPHAPVDARRIQLTPEGDYHFADFGYDRVRDRLLCVCEDHSDPTKQPITSIEAVHVPAGQERFRSKMEKVLVGSDFYSNPRISPDGSKLAWISWDHPNMPWDGSSLWVGQFDANGGIVKEKKVAGGEDESVVQPVWTSKGDLFFISDRSGWWNLYLLSDPERNYNPIAVYEKSSDFATPPWVFGLSNYCLIDDSTIACSNFERGSWRFSLLTTSTDWRSRNVRHVDLDFSDIAYLSTDGKHVAMLAGSPTLCPSIVTVDIQSSAFTVVKRSSALAADAGYISSAQPIEFPSERNYTSHAYFYPPKNKEFQAPEGELPPLLVKVHGGPTSAASNALSLPIQYWTSRGFAVMDVNYAGSSNYGRQYRQRLTLNWGLVDIEDCRNAAKYVIEQGWVDPKRVAITGGSAGGYTALSALTFTDVFATGASHYGVSNLTTLLSDTHKFESRYLDRIVGPYPAYKKVYASRSPINNVDKMNKPIIFFQGLEDKVVPPSQTETMVEALRRKKVPFCYIAYAGEQHGFRQAKNIKRTLDAEFLFYAKIFRFTAAESLDEIQIENFDLCQPAV